MVQKMNQSFQEGADSKLELIVFSHQPILQRVVALKIQSDGIAASSVMLLDLLIDFLRLEEITMCTIFFSQWQLA